MPMKRGIEKIIAGTGKKPSIVNQYWMTIDGFPFIWTLYYFISQCFLNHSRTGMS